MGDLVDDESGNEIIQHFLGDAVATHPLSGCCIPAVVHEARFAGHLNKIQIIPGVGKTNSPPYSSTFLVYDVCFLFQYFI